MAVRIWIVVLTIIAMTLLAPVSEACTLYGAAGSSVEGNGMLLGKNRDWKPDHLQTLKIVKPNSGYKYLALTTLSGHLPGAKAGINEKGFAVITASPPSELDKPEYFTGKRGVSYVLSQFKTVREALTALERNEWVSGPQFMMLSDGKELASIEFGPNMTYQIKVIQSGTLAHTNHYLTSELQKFNPQKPGSSKTRYDHVVKLLEAKDALNFDDVNRFAQDPVIWRSPADPLATRTIAAFQVSYSADGTILIYAKITNPGKDTWENRFALKDAFAGSVTLPQIS